MHAEGFWALIESGSLVDVQDGWGCEGGGGSEEAPSDAMAVMGPEPMAQVEQAEALERNRTVPCEVCGKRFTTLEGAKQHVMDKHVRGNAPAIDGWGKPK